jgi:hypothetical protein
VPASHVGRGKLPMVVVAIAGISIQSPRVFFPLPIQTRIGKDKKPRFKPFKLLKPFKRP